MHCLAWMKQSWRVFCLSWNFENISVQNLLGQSVPPILLYLPDLPWTIVSGNCSMITLNAMTKSNNWKMFICKSHIVWKFLKISHLKFSILALSEAIFVWSRCLTSSFRFFQKPKIDLYSTFFSTQNVEMRHFLWFSNTVRMWRVLSLMLIHIF